MLRLEERWLAEALRTQIRRTAPLRRKAVADRFSLTSSGLKTLACVSAIGLHSAMGGCVNTRSVRPLVLALLLSALAPVISGCPSGGGGSSSQPVAGGSPTPTASGGSPPPGAPGGGSPPPTGGGGSPAPGNPPTGGFAGTFTHHNDNARTGQNLSETVLTLANVRVQTFGKRFSYPLDGVAHASPLYVAGVNIPNQGIRNVVYVATEHDSVYAFDADGGMTTPLWKVSFINPAAGVTTVPPNETGETGDIMLEIGITGTPVIDPASGTLYVVAKTKEVSGATTAYVQRLHALDIMTGAEKFGGPVLIQASVPGVGFVPLRQNQRSALLLSNGVVYIGFGSHGDQPTYHGWLLGYSATTLEQVMAFCATPNADKGGIWMSNGGPAVDSTGNIYFTTGNGGFNAGTGDYGDTLVKLDPTGTVLDYFTPDNQAALDAADLDFGSGGILLLPNQPGPHPRLVITAGKNAAIHLINRDNLGKLSTGDANAVQSLPNIFPIGTSPIPGNYSAPVYFNGTVYFGPVGDTVKAFGLSNGLLSTAPTSQSSAPFSYPGGALAVSANGNADGILWAVERRGEAVGVLHAYDASNLGIELYNSEQAAASRDTLGAAAAKFSIPLVANGKVFVGSVSQLTVYGLLP